LFSNLLIMTMKIPDKGYSRNALCVLN